MEEVIKEMKYDVKKAPLGMYFKNVILFSFEFIKIHIQCSSNNY